jgi:hypothetical protein
MISSNGVWILTIDEFLIDISLLFAVILVLPAVSVYVDSLPKTLGSAAAPPKQLVEKLDVRRRFFIKRRVWKERTVTIPFMGFLKCTGSIVFAWLIATTIGQLSTIEIYA